MQGPMLEDDFSMSLAFKPYIFRRSSVLILVFAFLSFGSSALGAVEAADSTFFKDRLLFSLTGFRSTCKVQY